MTAHVADPPIPPLRPHPATATVDRRWVHRASVAEVFLTDVRHSGAGTFTAHCQLPRRHAYHSDHTPGRIDPMLLLESCRQAETCGAHTCLGMPLDTKFVLNRWSLDCLSHTYDDRTPVTLRIDVRADVRCRAIGRTTECGYVMDLTADGDPLGQATMTVTYLEPARYRALRTMRRCGPPPMSTELAAPGTRDRRLPGDITFGRRDPRNVLLDDVVRSGGTATATLVPPVDHASLFDHPLDHVPGAAVTEAAAQLAAAATGGEITGFSGEFHRFVELDDVTTLSAAPATPGGEVGVRVQQSGTVVADLRIRVELRPGQVPA